MGKGLYDFVVLTSTVRDYNGGGTLSFRGFDIYSKSIHVVEGFMISWLRHLQ
jgi:hypothetical protein